MTQTKYNIYSLGDHAITIEIANVIDEAVNNKCIALAKHIGNANIEGVKDITSCYSTVSVIYDPVLVHIKYHASSPSAFIRNKLIELTESCDWKYAVNSKKITIPVCFDIAVAPDLENMAGVKRLTIDELIDRYISRSYRVYMLGFLPGFPYMGRVDDELAMPRKEKPHLKIAAGSIGIAGNQTGIYPLDSPGGWNIIGRTPVQMFNLKKPAVCLLKAGDHVQFESIDLKKFYQLNQNN